MTPTHGSMSTLTEQNVDTALIKPATCGRVGSSYRKHKKW